MPTGFRLFLVSILQALFYDLLGAGSIIGSVDTKVEGSHPDLGTYHPCKKLNPQGVLVGGGSQVFGIMTDDGDESVEINVDDSDKDKKFVMDIDICFTNIKGAESLKIPDVSYLNSAMVLLVIACINNDKAIVPIKGRIINGP
ncbi:unnamed protein product [Mucor hiemalis]